MYQIPLNKKMILLQLINNDVAPWQLCLNGMQVCYNGDML